MARYANRQAASHCCHSSFLTYFLTKGIKMLKPSKRHFILYDAQTYEQTGITQCGGNVRAMAQKPQLWRVSVNPITTDGKLIDKTRLVFAPKERLKLSELAPIINEHIHSIDDFLDKCISVIVCARVMTEGGL